MPAGSPRDRYLSHSTAKVMLSRTAPGRPIRDKPPTWVVSQWGSSTRVRAPTLTDLGMQDLAFIWCLVYLKQIQATWTKFEKRWSQVEFITQQIGNNLYYKYPQWASGQSFLCGSFLFHLIKAIITLILFSYMACWHQWSLYCILQKKGQSSQTSLWALSSHTGRVVFLENLSRAGEFLC